MNFKKLTERLPRFRRKKRISSLLFNKEHVAQHLKESVSSIESVFGHLSQNISDIDSKTRNLRSDCEVLLELAGGKGNGTEVLLEAAKTLEAPMDHVHNSIKERRKLGELMETCEQITNDLLERQNAMVTVLEPLKFMLVFYKIEAAHLSSDNQTTFIAVSHEIMRLHQMVDETFRENITQLKRAKATITKTLKSFIKEHAAHSKEVNQNRSDISNTIESLNRQLRDNSQKDIELYHATDSFQSAIENLVTALQTEDIFRQRCESIIDSLNDKPANISDQAWSLLQSRKISAAAKEMREASGEVQRSLKTILSQANELEDISIFMEQFESMTASADGMIQVLLDSFDSMTDIYAHSEKLSNESKEAVHPVEALVKGLSVIVTEVSINIQFIALNAQVRSIQVGEGSGLEVLAARTADISTQLGNLGDETANDIERMQAVVSELSTLIETDSESSTTQAKQLAKKGGSITNELHEMRNKTFDALSKVSETMQFVKDFVFQDCKKLGQLGTIADQLDSTAITILEESGIHHMDPLEIARLETEITEQLASSEKASHTSIQATKDSTTTLWNEDVVNDRLSTPAETGSIELF